MSNTMAAHEPINYLDSILNEEETRCEYGHQWRNFTISRSGRFKSKNKKRDIVDGKFFDSNAANATTTTATITTTAAASSSSRDGKNRSGAGVSHYFKEHEKMITAQQTSVSSKSFQHQQQQSSTWVRDKGDTHKSYYETNL